MRTIVQYALLLASFIVSCDPFQEDFIPQQNQLVINKNATDYYILANTPAVIDLRTIVTSLFTNVTMSISKDPDRGGLTPLNDFIFKYTPAPSFIEGQDQFVIEFATKVAVMMTTITVHMAQNTSSFPCSLYAVEDYSHAKPGRPVSIYFLSNDRICGIKTGEVFASISVSPSYGKAVIKGDTLVYTPETDFEGLDEIVYTISSEDNGQSETEDNLLVSHGLVTISVTSEECPFFIFDSLTLDLTDNAADSLNKGQCVGGYDIRVWDIDIPPCVHYGYYSKVISQSNQSGSICFGTDGSFAYYPDPDKIPKNDTATFEVCINGQCSQVRVFIVREDSG